METVRVLLSEGSSLTARETVTCLGPVGYHLEVLDPDPLCIARFSRWVRRVHRCPLPGVDPLGYLDRVRAVVADRQIDVVLPTHEQAWLFAAAGPLVADVPTAVANIASFDRVQSKIAFARLLDELALPQPQWRLINSSEDLADLPFPYWLKAALSTAGRGVRLVDGDRSRLAATDDLLGRSDGPVMAQQPAAGQYGQVQGLFDRGRLVAAHTSVQTGTGIGPSAAARLSVDHPLPREHIAMLGEALTWHGGLTLDYLHRDGIPQYIECNPRTVEPGNATASGVNLQQLQVRLTMHEELRSEPVIGRAGTRTHGTLALVLGAAAYQQSRQAVLAQLGSAVMRRGCYRHSTEQLTPVLRDPPSAAALAFVIAQALASPERATRLAGRTVARYSITADTVSRLPAPAGRTAVRMHDREAECDPLGMSEIRRLDFLGVPCQDPDRARAFYRDTLGLRPDAHAEYEFWAGGTCLAIWAPEQVGMTFVAQKGNPLPLGVDDVGAARAALEAKGVTFFGDTLDTGVCHMAFFTDPDGNDLMLHHRYAPYDSEDLA